MSDFPSKAFGLLAAFGTLALLSLWASAVEGQQAPVIAPGEDVAVAGILATNPTTPRERARAAKILADLDRPDLAKSYLKLVLAAKLDEAQLVALADEFGTSLFTEMATRAELAPEARQLSDAVLGAINKKVRDPKRLVTLIGQLDDPSADVRFQAQAGLLDARGDAVGPLLAAVVDPARAKQQASIRAVLAGLGDDARDPLIGVLEADNPKLVAQAIRTLGQMNARKAVVYLLARYASEKSPPEVRSAAAAALLRMTGNVPSAAEAASLLADEARRYFHHEAPLRADLDGRVRWWTWDKGKGQPVARDLPAADASRAMAARLAREAHTVDPEDAEIRLLYLGTMLEEAAYAAGLDNPLPDDPGTAMGKAAAFGPEVIEALLADAMKTGHAAAATAAAGILGRTATADSVLRRGAKPSALVLATRHADRRLRMAALGAIVELGPEGPYPGSSYIPEALQYFAATSGTRRVLLAGPSSEVTMQLAGYLTPLGYEVDTVITGREMVQQALRSPDYEMILVDANLGRPTVDLAIQQLRRDGRTAELPVAILARAGALARAKRIARRDPLAQAFPRPHSADVAHWQLGHLLAPVHSHMVPFEQRQKQAVRAIAWLAQLSADSQKLYDIGRVEETALAALYHPELGVEAAAMLGDLGTAGSQTALVDMASRWTQPVEVREAAAKAFGKSSRRYGLLLSTEQIRRQYDRYNASADRDAATQKIQGKILDYIEAPTSAVAPAKPRAAEPEKE